MATTNPPLVLFDGECNLCNGTVRFVVKRDGKGVFRYASLQSVEGQELLRRHQIPGDDAGSIVLIENGRAYVRSTAVLRILRRLRFPWRLFYTLILIPRPLRDAVYNFIARRRYRWFGRTNECAIDVAQQARNRFP